MHALGHALGGEAAARLAERLGLARRVATPCCGNCAEYLNASANHDRGSSVSMTGRSRAVISTVTIIVDLERREPIEVFAGKEAIAVAAWMHAHPSIEIVARNRARAYSEAVDIALPAATQVSDRQASAEQPARQRREAAIPTRATTAPSRPECKRR
ncbi:hypothetical protein ACU4GD_37990 [Cupriavidus basilensis]